MHTTRYARESHTRAYLANDNDCSNFYPPRASTIHHPLASPTPRSRRASALACRTHLSSLDVPRRKVGAWKLGCVWRCRFAWPDVRRPELGRPTERWAREYGCTAVPFAFLPLLLLPICLLLGSMCHRPSLDVSHRKVGSWKYGWHNNTICFAPCVRWPPLVCVQQ